MPTLFLLIFQSNFTIKHQQYIEYSTTKLNNNFYKFGLYILTPINSQRITSIKNIFIILY